MRKIFISVLCALCAFSSKTASAEHAAEQEFLEPLVLHHAHIENEFRVNNTFRENIREEAEEEGVEASYEDVFETELEVGIASEDHQFGVEAHIPFTNEGTEDDGSRIFSLGDMEIEPVRWAFVREEDQVWTASLGVVLPTGDRSRGSGEGAAIIEPHLLVDRKWKGWDLAVNLVPGFELTRGREVSLGWGVMAARELFEQGGFHVAASVEFAGESSLSGRPEGKDTVCAVPGLHMELPSEWKLRFGVRIPLTEEREEERAFLFQAGTHWGQ